MTEPVRRGSLAAVACGALVILAGCGWLPRVEPDWVMNRNPLPACGEERVDAGGGFDAEARRCLHDAYEAGRGAELVSRLTSVEGDEIVRYLRVHENGAIELFVDATRDRYGSGAWERLRCDRLLIVEEAEAPGLTFDDDMVFVEDGCEEEPIP